MSANKKRFLRKSGTCREHFLWVKIPVFMEKNVLIETFSAHLGVATDLGINVRTLSIKIVVIKRITLTSPISEVLHADVSACDKDGGSLLIGTDPAGNGHVPTEQSVILRGLLLCWEPFTGFTNCFQYTALSTKQHNLLKIQQGSKSSSLCSHIKAQQLPEGTKTYKS